MIRDESFIKTFAPRELSEESPLVKQIRELENRCSRLDNLLGEIIATFSIESNREHFRTMDVGSEFLGITDRWTTLYRGLAPSPR